MVDWSSFVIGAGAAAAFFTGFLKKAGEDVYSWLKRKVLPPKPYHPESVKVPRDFANQVLSSGDSGYSWVPEERLREFEEKGYTYYTRDNSKCYREVRIGSDVFNEYLMRQSEPQFF